MMRKTKLQRRHFHNTYTPMKYTCILVSVGAIKSEIMVLNGTFKELFVMDCYIMVIRHGLFKMFVNLPRNYERDMKHVCEMGSKIGNQSQAHRVGQLVTL